MSTTNISGPNVKTVLTIPQRAELAPWRLSLAHARPYNLLIWVTRGAAHSIVNGRRFAMNSHNALFIPANTLFSFTYEASCFGQTIALLESEPLDWPELPVLLRVREPKAQLTLTHYIEAIQEEVNTNDEMSERAAYAHAQLMMVWAHRYQSQRQPKKTSASERLLRAFCALIVQSETRPVAGGTMADFAASLGVTPTHLTRVCKSSCGITAADLLTQHSLQRARRYLEDDALKAVDISKRLGFSTPAYFTRFIKTHTGKTPSALRIAGKERRQEPISRVLQF